MSDDGMSHDVFRNSVSEWSWNRGPKDIQQPGTVQQPKSLIDSP